MAPNTMNSPPPLTHCRHVHSFKASKSSRDDDDTRGAEHNDHPFEFIFRRTSSTDSESTAASQWPQGVLSKLSTEKEEARDMPPGEHQLLKRSNPVVPTMLSSDYPDDLSVHNTDVGLNPPFYVIKFNADGMGQVIEQPLMTCPTLPINNRKRCRSNDFTPQAKQIKKTAATKQDETSMWYIPDGSHLARFAEVMETLLLPTMCAGAVKSTNLGALTPWHSSASMSLHQEPKAAYHSTSKHHQTTPFHHKSYMATTISACRAF